MYNRAKHARPSSEVNYLRLLICYNFSESPLLEMLEEDEEASVDNQYSLKKDTLSEAWKLTQDEFETCHFTLNVPRVPHCNNKLTVQLENIEEIISSFQSQLSSNSRRLDAAETFIRRARNGLIKRGSRKATPRDLQTPLKTRPLPHFTSQNSDSFYRNNGASKILREMSEEMQMMMTNLEIQIDEADSKRKKLQLRNINLTKQLYHKFNVINNITNQKQRLEETNQDLQKALNKSQGDNQNFVQLQADLENENQILRERLLNQLSLNEQLQTSQNLLKNQLNILREEKSHYKVKN